MLATTFMSETARDRLPWASMSLRRNLGTMTRLQMARLFWHLNSVSECIDWEYNLSMSNISRLSGHHLRRNSLITRAQMSLEIIGFMIKQAEGEHNSTHRGPTASIKAMRLIWIIGTSQRIKEMPLGRASTRQFIQQPKIEKPAQISELTLWSTNRARAPQSGNYLLMLLQGIRRSGHRMT